MCGSQDGPTIALLGSLLLVLGSLLVLAALYRYHTCECLFGQGAYDLPWWNSTVGLGFAAFVLGSLTAWRWLRVVLASRPLRLLGVASYGIFLWHYQLGDLLERAGLRDLVPSGGGQLAWLGLVAGPLAIIVGGLSWILVERPFLEQRPARQTPSAKRTLWPSPLGG